MSTTLVKELCKELSTIRKEHKQSLSKIARQMGTDSKQIWRLEHAQRDHKVGTIEKYASLLGYSIQFNFVKNARV